MPPELSPHTLSSFQNPAWVRPLALVLSSLAPLGAARVTAQEDPNPHPRTVSAAVSEFPPHGLDALTVPYLARSSAQSPEGSTDFLRFAYAARAHEEIFGANSPVLLVWPDHYLSYEPLGAGSRFDTNRLRERLIEQGRAVLLDGTYMQVKYDEAISTVRATTNLIGPAAFPLSERQAETPSLVAVVGYDSARPRTLALKSLAGISCPTAMLTRLIPRDDLHAFVLLHESGHAFQFLSGHKNDFEHESNYERCIAEAEADVFAALWWLKTRQGDAAVPTYFSHLRCSSFFEHTVRGNERVSLQYATDVSLRIALDIGARLVAEGTLAEMRPEEIYVKSRQIVQHTLPAERHIVELSRALHEALSQAWQLPFHARIERLEQMVRDGDIAPALQPAVEGYLESAAFLTEPSHLRVEYPDLASLPLNQQAEQIWIQELMADLQYAVAPALVLERYSTELSAAALGVWRLTTTSSDPEGLSRYIMHDGAPNTFFVPTERRSYYLDLTKKILEEKIRGMR